MFVFGLIGVFTSSTSRSGIDDEYVVMTTFIVIPFIANYIIGNGIKLFIRNA
ncbi:hypothetical protein VPHD518_0094 [Vibrio phage D518]